MTAEQRRGRACPGCPTCVMALAPHLDPALVFRGRLAQHWVALLDDPAFALALQVFALPGRSG